MRWLRALIPLKYRRLLRKRHPSLRAFRQFWITLNLQDHVTETPLPLMRVGSDYGGWWVPRDVIQPDWVCYCAGVGEDITFDLGLIAAHNCTVWAFDPTPRAIAHVAATIADEPRYRFLPYGLWSEDTTLTFYAPEDPQNVSHSALAGMRRPGSASFSAPVRALPSIMRELGHDRIDLLKLDIEGAEYAVLSAMLAEGILPHVLCVDFDQPQNIYSRAGVQLFFRPVQMVRHLQEAGYRLAHVDQMNCLFLHQALPG